ncbi:unnamed protein product [Rhizophagus irregularis]|nr:unnamed protein product [Rhizophagus irregularis]
MSKINPIILSDIKTISDDETISEDEYSEKDEQNINEDEEPIAFFTKYLSVPEVIHSALPIEYPKTSPQGVATIFNITGWANPMACFNDIQYSNNGTGGSTTIQNCPYFGVSAKLRRIIINGGEEFFIGCDKWIRGEKWHQYIKVQEEIDLELLRDLFQG